MTIKVGVFYGGRSVEHEVSIISGLQAAHAIDSAKYKVIPVYITKNGMFYTGDALWDIEKYQNIDKLLSLCQRILIVNEHNETVLLKYPFTAFGKKVIDNLDIAFPVMHGTNGEDGTLQGYFETINLPYVGPDVVSSAACMDKIVMKRLLKEASLPIVDYVWFMSKEWYEDADKIMNEIENRLKFPVIVKPYNLGSSVGVSAAASREELEDAVILASKYAEKIIVEKMIVNLKEVNCSVLGDKDEAEASVCEEPVSSADVLSFQDKYVKSNTKGMSGALRKIPADLPDSIAAKIQDLAKSVFITLGCSGVSRVDFLIDLDGNNIYVNEINTIPGSLSFYLWEASGMKFNELVERLIQIGLKKHREKEKLIFTYESNLLSQKGLKGIKK